ncbi:sodium/glutamate symporter [Polyangium spumosum]|uniref:Sodium/glutamate symporter n=1 Tax=Polyangium spumosum TaxID=889282 RepID=A0A6N7Q167_9BACT|nr:sodium/glutamate symporter [Polyangium spumosum]MRG96335.1 sodium/glutamate symporter [Polyangium spumosum]
MDVPTYSISSIQVLGLACFGLVLGRGIRRLAPVFERLSIPASILGGLVYAIVGLALRDRVCNFKFDLALRDILMIAFFTTVGMTASLRLLALGGRRVAIFLGAAVLGLLAQMGWGAGAAKVMGLPPLLGVIPGAVSLTGGPATALAFGPVFEEAGVPGATAIGLASAVFGITVSGLLGGFVGSFLIRRHALRPGASDAMPAPAIDIDAGPSERHGDYLSHIIALGVAMALGSLLSAQFSAWKLTLPAYIGAMIVAGVMRNLDDRLQFAGIDQDKMEAIGGIALELFIVMALLTLELWQLQTLALPVLLILIGQVVLTIGLCWTAIYWMMGRSYTSAVMAGGYCGFMLGTTANSLACMNEIVRKSGPAPQAFFAVSIVGAFLIDFINALLVTQALNVLR